ncbi:hypothetical protein FisN_10Hh342 [Fistulifera solaris]|uniref:Spondin domain-containing protein n=1 Tax=Fistulifera solaris TaxID=1519565 RepID=A0A1Z5JR95_FISSO|nr:hypothetical protein FisN_10Hh342 [Fistulifera solaris]|eukprot:GAX16416.1 hypothetical protein FisN_10Hh342 [Fistulifera solaris]
MNRKEFLARLVVSAVWLLTVITAQQIGVDLCACQPAVYSVRLQFNLTCSDATIAAGLPGIEDTTCLVDKSTDANLTDFVPTMINEIQFFETDQEGNIVQQNLFADGYVDGEVLNYTSFLLLSNAIDVVSLPSALSVFATGQNAAGEPIINTWAIEFTNDCAVHPVITTGQRIGWTVFKEVQDPPVEPLLCPLVSSMPSEVTTIVPTVARTEAPVGAPALVPEGPSLSPVATLAPVASPLATGAPGNTTMSPIAAATPAPATTTASPVAERTPAPVTTTTSPMAAATPAPTTTTASPVAVRTPAPVLMPNAAPVDSTQTPVAGTTSAPVAASVPTSAPTLVSDLPSMTPNVTAVPVPVPTKSPSVEKTAAPSCEISGKRQSNHANVSSPVGGKRAPNRSMSRRRSKPEDSADAPMKRKRNKQSSDVTEKRRRRRRRKRDDRASPSRNRNRRRRRPGNRLPLSRKGSNKASKKDSKHDSKAANGKRRGSDYEGSAHRQLHVGPHAPYAYPSGCPEPLP